MVDTTTRFLAAALMVVLLPLGAAVAQEAPRLDPLLDLLVRKGVITREEAVALQAEYDAAKTAGPPPAAAAAASPAPEPAATPPAAEAAPPEKARGSWTDRFEVKGDLRLRYEGFSKTGAYDDDRRDRFRIRLRAGFEATVTEWMLVGLEVRSGDPADPVSNNVSFKGAFQFKDFSLGEGYLQVRPSAGFGLVAGKFDAKKWWTVTDMQWDDDVTVEGLMTNVDLLRGGGALRKLDLVAYGYLLGEQKNGPDAALYGGQLRSTFALGGPNTLHAGVGFDWWVNPQQVADLTLSGDLKGNPVTNFLDEDGRLVSDFEILNLFVTYTNRSSERWPVKLKLFYYTNTGARGIGADHDTGYFGRIQVGEYAKKGRVAFRYSYYYSEPDALFYVFTQSDTSRGSDVKAHRLDLRIGAWARSYFNLTWYSTRPQFRQDTTLNRWQVDYIVKF